MIHVYRWDRAVLCVPPEGNPAGKKYRHGDWMCVMCKELGSLHARFDLDHGTDCPGKENT